MTQLPAPTDQSSRVRLGGSRDLPVIPDLIGNPSSSSLTSGFRAWLHAKNYSDSTVRNYLVDINKYLTFCHSERSRGISDLSTSPPTGGSAQDDKSVVFSDSTLSTYISQISTDLNASRTLASLSLFCQYALDQNIISANPFKKSILLARRSLGEGGSKNANLDSLLDSFKIFLFKHHKTAHTVTNYIADIKQFINFCQNTQSTLSQSPLSKGDIEGLKTIT